LHLFYQCIYRVKKLCDFGEGILVVVGCRTITNIIIIIISTTTIEISESFSAGGCCCYRRLLWRTTAAFPSQQFVFSECWHTVALLEGTQGSVAIVLVLEVLLVMTVVVVRMVLVTIYKYK
jgi:hypothetical protein